MKTLSLVFFSCLLAILQLSAQKPDASTAPLTKAEVENFVGNFKKVEADFKALDVDYKPESDYQSSLAKLQNFDEVNSMIKKYGFKDFADFTRIAWKITACYASIKIDSQQSPELKKVIQQIDDDPNMTTEQKAKAKEQIKQAMEGMQKAFDSSTKKEDIAIVTPYMKQLDNLFE